MIPASGSRPLRVLLVERSPSALSTLSELLQRRFGARMDLAATIDAGEALALASQGKAEIVIANLHPAQGDGLQLCKALRAQPATAGLAIMLLGDQVTVRDKIAGFMSGADDFIVRPVDERLLAARIELLCRIKSMGRLRGVGPDRGE
jgi:DNA-binding response OmpR family regulator